jgi:hypothetical protein
MVTSKPAMGKDEFLQAIKNAQNFDDLTKIIKHYQGFGEIDAFRLVLAKCMQFAGCGFALSNEFPVWQRLFATVANDDSIVFVFATGLVLEFRKERGGKARMRVFTAAGGGVEW